MFEYGSSLGIGLHIVLIIHIFSVLVTYGSGFGIKLHMVLASLVVCMKVVLTKSKRITKEATVKRELIIFLKIYKI